MEAENKKPLGRLAAPILGLLTLIVAIVAAIPGFLSLNKEKPLIYYHVHTSHVSIPSTLDTQQAINALQSAGIPGTTVEISLINQGNASQDETKLEIRLPSQILEVWSHPTVSSNPIWVSLPGLDFENGKKVFQSSIRDFGTTQVLSFFVGAKYTPDSNAEVRVFANGSPATKVNDVKLVPPWSKWKVFTLPLYILGAGVVLIFLWSFIVALANNPSLRNSIIDNLIESAHIGYSPKAVSAIFDEMKNLHKLEETKKEKQESKDDS